MPPKQVSNSSSSSDGLPSLAQLVTAPRPQTRRATSPPDGAPNARRRRRTPAANASASVAPPATNRPENGDQPGDRHGLSDSPIPANDSHPQVDPTPEDDSTPENLPEGVAHPEAPAHQGAVGYAAIEIVEAAPSTPQELRAHAESLFVIEQPYGPLWNDDAYCVFPAEAGRLKRQLRGSWRLMAAEYAARGLIGPSQGFQNMSGDRTSRICELIVKHEDQRRRQLAQLREARRLLAEGTATRLVETETGLLREPSTQAPSRSSGRGGPRRRQTTEARAPFRKPFMDCDDCGEDLSTLTEAQLVAHHAAHLVVDDDEDHTQPSAGDPSVPIPGVASTTPPQAAARGAPAAVPSAVAGPSTAVNPSATARPARTTRRATRPPTAAGTSTAARPATAARRPNRTATTAGPSTALIPADPSNAAGPAATARPARNARPATTATVPTVAGASTSRAGRGPPPPVQANSGQPIRIQIVSDAHEQNLTRWRITPHAPILALLGDIRQISTGAAYNNWLDRHLLLFKKIILVYGNNEAYRSSWASIRAVMNAAQARRQAANTPGAGELIILDKTTHRLSDDVLILGCTLNSNITPDQRDNCQNGRQEFSIIQDWDVERHNAVHKDHLAWLNSTVTSLAAESGNSKIVVFTHHSPCEDVRSIAPQFLVSNTSSAMHTDLSNEPCWTEPKVVLWAWGHTHWSCDFADPVTGKRLCANQREMNIAGNSYRPDFVVDI